MNAEEIVSDCEEDGGRLARISGESPQVYAPRSKTDGITQAGGSPVLFLVQIKVPVVGDVEKRIFLNRIRTVGAGVGLSDTNAHA